MSALVLRQKPFEAWIFDSAAAGRSKPTSRRFATEAEAKAWLMDRISEELSTTEYGAEGPGLSYLSPELSARVRRTGLGGCAICRNPSPRVIDPEHGALCEDCAEDIAAGADHDPLASLTDAIFPEDDYHD